MPVSVRTVIKLPRALLSELPQDERFAQLGKHHQVCGFAESVSSLFALLNGRYTGTRKQPEEHLRAVESALPCATEAVWFYWMSPSVLPTFSNMVNTRSSCSSA